MAVAAFTGGLLFASIRQWRAIKRQGRIAREAMQIAHRPWLIVTAITNDARFLFFDELAADVINDYEINDKRAIKEVRRNIEKHLKPVFRGWKAAAITTADIRK